MEKDPKYGEMITEHQKLTEKVEWLEGAFNAHREEGLEIKSRFLSNLSHEIRTPMNAILGFSSLLHNEKLSDTERDEYVSYISYNSRALLKILDNIIDLSLLETDNLTLRKEEIFARELIGEIYESYQREMIRTTKKRVAYLKSLPPGNDRVIVQADGHRLRRVIDNLVGSATTYQRKGVIELKMEIPDERRVVFSVSCDENTLLFDRAKMIFDTVTGDDTWYNELDNTGVALKLAKGLVQSMGGETSVRQESNSRFRFCVEMPVKERKLMKNNGSKLDIQAILI